jgi:hypothetical protein
MLDGKGQLGDEEGMNAILSALIILAGAATAPAPPAMPPPLTADQSERITCVAALAIAAGEQQRDAPGWQGLIWLPQRGAHFAGVTGDTIMKEAGWTREQVRAEMVQAVSTFQKQAVTAKDGRFLRSRVESCITLMDALDPPPPSPGLVQCAAMVSLAELEVRGREGASKTATDLGNMAAILDNGARKELKEAGRSGNEADVILGLEKDRLATVSKDNRAKGLSDSLDFESCFKRAGELQRAQAKSHG